MSEITAQMVKALRDKTGAGMADCKKALTENNGDMEASIEYLRKKGAASAAKRGDRETNEGLIAALVSDDSKTAAYVEVTCETDFVARNEEFVNYVNNLAIAIMNNNFADKDALLAADLGGITVEQAHNGILAKFSEKIDIARFGKIQSNGYIATYIHGGSKLAVITDFDVQNMNDVAKQLTLDICMQAAAMAPICLDRSQVSADTLNKEIEIYKEQAIQEGKKPEIAEKVALGRVEKFYKESCLIEQVFVKDSKLTVADVVAQISKETGASAKINSFIRISIGS